MGAQYDEFLTTENFILAYQRLKTVQRDDYKEFFYRDFDAFELFFQANIEQLICEIRENIYAPQSCYKYYMPKKKNLARPITMISLIDQIVYQAITNIIADVFHPKLSRYFNLNTYGNLFKKSDDSDAIFFYEPWKKQWKRFNDQKRRYFNEGYSFVVEFDIASFYDTIDHQILCELLKNHGVDIELIDFFKKCLYAWTFFPASTLKHKKSIGIPQGPVSSAFWAEVYLFEIDNAIRDQKKIDLRYFRYADDISIMAKNEMECKKAVVLLDLLSRDLSLIPQSEKIGITHIDNIGRHINSSKMKFSKVAKEYKKNAGVLKDSTHNSIKKDFLSCFDRNDDNYLNKTILSFSLFKMNKDDEVKEKILANISDLELHFKGILFYFGIHYPNDTKYNSYIQSYLLGDTTLFQYNKALIFKNYKQLSFDERIFRSNLKNLDIFWIVKYQMIDWLKRTRKLELVSQISSNDNYYIERERRYLEFEGMKDLVAKEIFLEKLISSDDILLSIHGLYLWFENYLTLPKIEDGNDYVKRILAGEEKDYIEHILKHEFKICEMQQFITICKQNDTVYKEMKDNIRLYLNNKNIDPSTALMALNLFNNIIFDVLARQLNYKSDEYGGSLEQLNDKFPLACTSFKLINETRNQRTLAHYKDKQGNPRIKISVTDLEKLIAQANIGEAYCEIFSYFESITCCAI